MKAMVLCAGKGTRLGQLAVERPKPMLEVAGRPILAYILANLAHSGFQDVVINLHHQADAIQDGIGDGAALGLRITYLRETELLGTAGGVKHAAHLLQGPEPFLVHYGDVLTDQDLGAMVAFHRAKGALLTLLLHQRGRSNSIVCLDRDQRVERLLERPTEAERATVSSPWVNSGVYLMEPSVLDVIPDGVPADFPKQIFPALIATGRVYGFPLSGFRVAIDSPERLALARASMPARWPGLD
jgi:mannose-1-phosphate guanylyltransferase/phosphomannomutase